MTTPPRSSQLQRFIDDEFDRAPLLMQEVIGATLDAIRQGSAPSQQERRLLFELQRPLSQHTPSLISSFVEALRSQVEAPSARPAGAPRPGLSLGLLDEAAVAADVEISRAIEAINNLAESELRELRRYTAALAGDADVACESNPFRPEVYVRALWQATQALPLAPHIQLTLMHHFATPLAQALRHTYRSAANRLEDRGVEPAAYRTVVLPPGSRRSRPTDDRHELSSDMNRLRETMPAPFLDLQLDIPDTAPVPAAALASAPTPDPQQQQLAAILARLFETMLADPSLPAMLHGPIAGLRGSVSSLALAEPAMIDDESHAVWRFIDRLAFAAEVPLFDAAALDRWLRVAQALIDHIARAPVHDSALYRWGTERLAAFEQHALQQRRGQAAAQITALQRVDGPFNGLSGSPAPEASALDADSLDTVPASLLDLAAIDALAKTSRAQKWLHARGAGDVLRVFLGGHWTAAQLLWQSDAGDLWLIAALPEGATWGLRRGAVERLWIEGLVDVLAPRSLVHDAAKQVLKQWTATLGNG